jgi:hypothetical protein
MITRTVTTVLPAPRDEVFQFISRIENLPRWANEFARELRLEDGKAKVVNGLGEFFFSIEADERTGVIDMFAGPTEAEMAIFPSRVIALRPRQSAFSFTMFKDPEMSDELFEAQHRSLQREVENLRAVFRPHADA